METLWVGQRAKALEIGKTNVHKAKPMYIRHLPIKSLVRPQLSYL